VQNQHNALNQLTARTVRGLGGLLLSDSTYTYDKRGNLIGETDAFTGTTQTYEYDATNKLVRGVNANGETSAYTYNGLGILVAHSATTAEGTVTTEYVPDFTSPVESNLMAYGSDGVVYRHTYGVGLSKIATTVKTSADVLKLYVQNDRLGSGLFATDTQGDLLGHVYRDQWGYRTDVAQPELNGNPLNILDNFTNHEYDEILGIYYAKARFYDPVTMRFMAIDPIRDGTNWYMYAGNNPMRYTDPLGLKLAVDDMLPQKKRDESLERVTFDELWRGSLGAVTVLGEFLLFPVNAAVSALSMPEEVIRENYKNNSKQVFEDFPGNGYNYIYDQYSGSASKIKMGYFSSFNACGWVATYNTLLTLGLAEHPADIVKDFETNFGIILDGGFGVNPMSIYEFFRQSKYDDEGISTRIHHYPKSVDELVKNSDVAILNYAHGSGLHYISVGYDKNTLQFYTLNDGRIKAGVDMHFSLDDYLLKNGFTAFNVITIEDRRTP
jgi:RHS repeat-associated protein